jgi:hypothetical protein
MIRTSVESQFELEVKYNFESDPPIVSLKIPLSELQALMANPNGAIKISHQEFVETLSALSIDPVAPLHDRGVAIDLLKRSS